MAKLFVTLAIVCLSCAVVVQGSESFEDCKTKTGATDGDVMLLLSDIKPDITEKAKCLLACYMQQSGVMDSEGKLNTKDMIANIKKYSTDPREIEGRTEVVNICNNIPVPGEVCENAVAYTKCLKEKSEKFDVE